MIGTKSAKVLENYMVIEYDDKQVGFKTMEQCLNYLAEHDITEYKVFNVAEVKIKVLVREEPIDYGE